MMCSTHFVLFFIMMYCRAGVSSCAVVAELCNSRRRYGIIRYTIPYCTSKLTSSRTLHSILTVQYFPPPHIIVTPREVSSPMFLPLLPPSPPPFPRPLRRTNLLQRPCAPFPSYPSSLRRPAPTFPWPACAAPHESAPHLPRTSYLPRQCPRLCSAVLPWSGAFRHRHCHPP